jgi:tripartite-type tricarboxylate transporter receptor subunit TctC
VSRQRARIGALAILGASRSAIFPDVPTIEEVGFAGFEASVWYGRVAPTATPKPIIAKLHAEMQKTLQTPEVRKRMIAVGGEVTRPAPSNLARGSQSERLRYEKLVRQAGIKPD